MCGITNCEKTEYVLEFLLTVYNNKFDYILIFCPTFRYNKTYDKSFIFKDDIFIYTPTNNLDELLELAIKTFANMRNILFLADDCANLNDTKR